MVFGTSGRAYFYCCMYLYVLINNLSMCSGGAELLFDNIKKHNVTLPDKEKPCKNIDLYLKY